MSRAVSSIRRGVVLPSLPFVLVLMVCVLAFSIDLSWCYSERSNLQNAADAAAMAAAMELRENAQLGSVQTAGKEFANFNEGDAGDVLENGDINFGHWDSVQREFTDQGVANAVRVTVKRDGSGTTQRISTWFMGFFGVGDMDCRCTSIAAFEPMSACADLILDDDTLHPSLQPVQDLADSLGRSAESLVADADGDGFIDIPTGATLTLPAGTYGHPGVFEMGKDFPFGAGQSYSLRDFMTAGTALEQTAVPLNSVQSVRPMGDDSLAALPVGATYLAAVFVNDILTTNKVVAGKTVLTADLTVPRAGLLAFKLLGVSHLETQRSELSIEVVGPESVDMGNLGRRYELRRVIRVR